MVLSGAAKGVLELRVERRWAAPTDTIGAMMVNGAFFCFTLEDRVREPGVKVPGQTAIPTGRYELLITPSQRFKEELPLLVNVPGFEGIRIHTGNTDADTEGCILVGCSLSGKGPAGPDFVLGESRKALAILMPTLRGGLAGGPCFVTVA